MNLDEKIFFLGSIYMYWKAIKENNCYKTVDLLQNYRLCDGKDRHIEMSDFI